ncbi:MAG: hypothetical protein LBR70_02315 [Lactobacillaceae bacterium]|jgi:hypothetical protein|nr:hypothetical protein [Lactobacillaceae bacterium]
MKKIILFSVFCLFTLAGFAQEQVTNKEAFKAEKKEDPGIILEKPNYPLTSLSEVYLGPGASHIFRTGLAYRGFYGFVETYEYEKDWSFGGGLAYDGVFKENTYYRGLVSYSQGQLYGLAMIWHDFDLKPINLQPIFFVDSNLEASLGFFIPFNICKNLSGGFWVAQGFASKNGFGLSKLQFEVDLYVSFDVVKNLFKGKRK